tara:strand:- start:2690 stop:3367 length:678 start_codon:yes stop_codon:yes gene_type:complete
MKTIGIIPARGGSKGIPGKNIKTISGKPLIEFTIESAFDSKSIDTLVVSTDSNDIISAVKKYKNLVIVKRPIELCTDYSTTESCLLHACKQVEDKINVMHDIVVTLEPTSPLRKKDTISKAVNILKNKNFDSVMGVVETDSLIGRIIDNKFEYIFKNQSRRRQDRLFLYKESSTIWATKYDALKKNNSVLGKKIYPLIVSKEEAIDINTNFDFISAEAHLINNKL